MKAEFTAIVEAAFCCNHGEKLRILSNLYYQKGAQWTI